MPYVTQIKIGDNRTVFFNGGNAKCEREMTVSFAFGELKVGDEAMIKGYFRQVGELVKLAVDEGLQGEMSDVRPPPQKMAPQTSTGKASPSPTSPSPPKQETSSKPAGPPHAAPPEGPETIEGEPAYDRAKLHWNYCDEIVERDGKKVLCGNREIDAETEKTNKQGKTYTKKWQGCFQCGVFLNADGKKVPMQPREENA